MPVDISITMTMIMSNGPDTPPPLEGLGREADQGWGEGESLPISDRAFLHLLTWLSPAFPTGAFAYSHGIEWAVESGDITDGDTLRDWLATLLTHGAPRSDAILLRHALNPNADLDMLAELAAATAPGRERYAETLNQGAAFMRAARPWGCPTLPDPVAYPIAVGALAALHHIDANASALAYLHAVTVNLISAAVRLVPLGQSTGLAVLAALEPIILRIAAETSSATLDDLGGAVFRSDLAAMLHETQYTRLFRS
jgi:urease accessory protein